MDPNNPTLNSQDDGNRISTDNSQTEETSEETEATPPSTIVNPQYYNVMDDYGPDEVFILPPSLLSRLDPEGGSTCEATTDPSVTLGPSDATEPDANPGCLDWHHGEKHLTTAHTQVKEEIESALPTLEEDASSNYSSNKELIGQEQTTKEGTIFQGTLVDNCNYTSKDQDFGERSFGLSEDRMVNEDLSKSSVCIDILEEIGTKDICKNFERHDPTSQDLEIVNEDNQNKMDALNERPDILQGENIDSNHSTPRCSDSGLTGYDWVRRTSEEIHDGGDEQRGLDGQEEETLQEGNNRIATEILQGENLLQRLQLVQLRQDLTECPSTPQQMAEEGLMVEESVAKEVPEMTHEIQEHTNHEPNEGSAMSTLSPQLESYSGDKTEVDSGSNEEGDCLDSDHFQGKSPDEATGISKHSELPEQELDTPECQSTPKQTATNASLTQQWERESGELESTVKDKKEKTEESHFSDNEDNQHPKEETSSQVLSEQKTEADYSEQSDYCRSMSANDENRITFPPCHRFSTAETFMEKQFQEASQRKQDLQRAEGVFDLTDNPDVLEIPFKTNVSLEPLPPREGLSEKWQFSEQKMQKEISQEMQRELVLVNQGKIPGGYSKGESQHMKDKKLLFEAFQQEKMEGPTRFRKPQSSQKSQVYPSVLERTRSLEMFSQKASPMVRTYSVRLVSSATCEKEKCPDSLRSQSPSGRDKARLSPYPKHEKPLRLHKSMDSISTNSPIAKDKMRKTKEEPLREGSPLLKENPFFKLRPALALQPEVEKDIREAKKREEELHKQRSSLYGETRQSTNDDMKSTSKLQSDPRQKTTGKLERVWPPPSKKDLAKCEQQEAKVQRGAGQRAPLWQRWESGLINGQTAPKDNSK